MTEYDVVEIKPDETKVVAERKRTLLLKVGDKYLAVFRDKIRKFRRHLTAGETFYVSVAKLEEVDWKWFGIHPIPEPEVWKVTAVHKEKFTPVPHRLLAETLRDTLERMGVQNPEISFKTTKFRTFILWRDGNSGIAIAHKNTAEKGIWVFQFFGAHIIPIGGIRRTYHTGTIEDIVNRVREAIVETYKEYDRNRAEEIWKETVETVYDRSIVEIYLSKLMSRAPQYVKRYLTQLYRQRKISGQTLVNTILKVLKEQEKRKQPNVLVMEAAWEVLAMLSTTAGRRIMRQTPRQREQSAKEHQRKAEMPAEPVQQPQTQ